MAIKTKKIPVSDILIENESMELYPVELENKFGERDAFVNLLWTKKQHVVKDTKVYLMTSYCEDFFEDAFATTPVCEKSCNGGESYRLRYLIHPYYGLIRMNELRTCPLNCMPETCSMSVQNALDLVQMIAQKDPKANCKLQPRLLIFYAENYICGEENDTSKSGEENDTSKNGPTEIKNSWMIWDCSQKQKVKEKAEIRDINISLIMDYLTFLQAVKNNPLPLSKELPTKEDLDDEKEYPEKDIEVFIDPIIEGKLMKFLDGLEESQIYEIIQRAIEEHGAEIDCEMLDVDIKTQKKFILEMDLLIKDLVLGDEVAEIIAKK
jgi:hypothetical protein